MDKKVVIGVMLASAILLVVGVVIAAGRPQRATSGNPASTEAQRIDLKIDSTDWAKGSPTAPVVVVEYADFQCPSCAAYYQVTKKLVEEMPDKLRLVYRTFPLTSIHDKAWISAKSAEAAGMQGKFWEMHDRLYAEQTNWSQKSPAEALKIFEGYAKDLGLDVAKWNKDVDSAQADTAVRKGFDSANTLGLDGTPTFFVNGVMISLPGTYERFKNIIEETAASVQKN